MYGNDDMNNMNNIIKDHCFIKKSSTKTYIGVLQIKCEKQYSVADIHGFMTNSIQTQLRNCILKKVNGKCIKLYTNFSVQINGNVNVEEIANLLNHVNVSETYNFKCVMSNWNIRLSEVPIDLDKLMDKLNNNNITAYYLRGPSLIVKYMFNDLLPIFEAVWIEGKYVMQPPKMLLTDIKISVRLFKSGNCIISGSTEKCCVDFILILLSYL